jgi:hypothetical protein
MRLFQIFLFFLLLGCNTFEKQQGVNMKVQVFNLDIEAQKADFEEWVKQNIVVAPNDTTAKRYESTSNHKFAGEKLPSIQCDYEDDNFEVYSACGGEWGGFLFFLDKKDNKKKYSFPCTCPKMIDFQNGQYIITETLAHGQGFMKITTLSNPRALPFIPEDKLWNHHPEPLPSSVGQRIIDTSGIMANVFYPFKGKSFLIFTTTDTTFLGEISHKKIINVQPILSHGTWSYYNHFDVIKNKIYISQINNYSEGTYGRDTFSTTKIVKGYIYIKQDSVLLGYHFQKTIK